MIIWLIFLFVFITGFLVLNEFIDKHTFLFVSLIALAFVSVASFRPSFLDYQVYVNYFYTIDDIFIEPSFYFIVKILKFLNLSYIYLFIFFAILSVILKIIAININSRYIYYSLLIYLSYYFILHGLHLERTRSSMCKCDTINRSVHAGACDESIRKPTWPRRDAQVRTPECISCRTISLHVTTPLSLSVPVILVAVPVCRRRRRQFRLPLRRWQRLSFARLL
jgi:hypothetical protein